MLSRLARASAATAALTVTHASFYYMGKRNVDIKETKQQIVKNVKDGVTLSIIPLIAFSLTTNEVIGPLLVTPCVTHWLSFQLGKYHAISENEKIEKENSSCNPSMSPV